MSTVLINGECLHQMSKLSDGSVDMILADLPYGILNKKNKDAQWDSVIPFEKLWKEYERIIKPNGAIVLFGSGMFTAKLMLSNTKLWRYNLIWQKGGRVTGFLNAKKMPLREHEDIVVFYKQQPTYNPQMVYAPEHKNHTRGKQEKELTNRCYGEMHAVPDLISDYKYPRSILSFKKPHPAIHPTQKPVELCEWLIKTYTNEGDLVLDNVMGSGTTGIAAANTGRNFIGIENNEKYFNLAEKRIKEVTDDVFLVIPAQNLEN